MPRNTAVPSTHTKSRYYLVMYRHLETQPSPYGKADSYANPIQSFRLCSDRFCQAKTYLVRAKKRNTLLVRNRTRRWCSGHLFVCSCDPAVRSLGSEKVEPPTLPRPWYVQNLLPRPCLDPAREILKSPEPTRGSGHTIRAEPWL